ncbi:MAG: matrixin family metalloprotease [Actinomycetota bacterium]|nr:matrixin family metalloprotease [Actinomycetota bacterium]
MHEDHNLGDLLRLRPRAGDVAALGLSQARLAAVVRLGNAVVFAVAFAVALARIVPAVADERPFGHWPSGQRDLVVVDRTGDPAWHQASRHAVEVWNQAGADLRLTWAEGDGACAYDGPRISVCTASEESLEGVVQFQGLSDQETDEDGHAQAAFVEVCGDCGLNDVLRRVVATHEIGHALGLRHNNRLGSVVYPIGGTDQPDEEDYAELRRLHDHLDGSG